MVSKVGLKNAQIKCDWHRAFGERRYLHRIAEKHRFLGVPIDSVSYRLLIELASMSEAVELKDEYELGRCGRCF